MAVPEEKFEWLLRAEETEKLVPVSSRMVMDDEFWNARIERLEPSEGLRLFLTTADVHREFVFDTRQSDPEPLLFCHVPVSGHARLGFGDGMSVELDPSQSAIFLPATRRGIFTFSPQRALRHAGLGLRTTRVAQIFGEDMPGILAELIREKQTTRLIETATGMRLRRLGGQLFDETLRGSLRLVFLEGVALQVLALQAAAAGARRRRPAGLTRSMRGVAMEARERLLADIADPPSLGELARALGVSERPLNAAFRSLYGGTVYEVLRDERLNHAREALEVGGASIKQIAFRVGYSHASNFTAAFTKRFGQPPLRYVRNQSRDQGAD
jgi:AraC-like DNA-binding protein